MSRTSVVDDTWKIRFRSGDKIKTSLVTAKDHKRAEQIASSYHNVLSVSKARNDYYRITADERNHFTTKITEENNRPNISPIARDEFLWLRRNKRVENREKDKLDNNEKL